MGIEEDHVNQVRSRELRLDFTTAAGGDATGNAKYEGVVKLLGIGWPLCPDRGKLKALPMSLSVSLRARTFIDGAIAGT